MFNKMKHFSSTRKAWCLLLLCVIFFEACALFFQHVLMLAPCVMCIYERLAMLGIGGAAIVGLILPNNILVRAIALLGWGIGAYKGLVLSLEHVNYQLHPSPFATCDLFVKLPSFLPLDKWMPWMFEASGECSKIVWRFLTLTMPQWLVIIFAANLLVCFVFILVQPFSKKA
jgi:protein dithiol:quinone oxidoreductase